MKNITFGLTGGIACGKSSVTYTFEYHGIPMVDADKVARQVVEPDTLGWHCIKAVFGQEYLNEDRTLNRSKLGALVFSNKEKKLLLEALMTPWIRCESRKQLDDHHSNGHQLVGYDAALILERGNADKFRPLVVVACPLKIQLARLMKRNSLSEEAAMNIINSQMPTEEKIKHADFVIDTSGSIDDSIAQTEKVIEKLRKMVE